MNGCQLAVSKEARQEAIELLEVRTDCAAEVEGQCP